MDDKNVTINLSSSAIIKAIVIIGIAAFLYFLRDIVMVLLTAVIISSAIDPGVKWFEGKKIPRAFGVILIYILLAIIFFIIIFFIIPTFLSETSTVIANIPTYMGQISNSIPLLDKSFLEGYIPILKQISTEIANTNISGLFNSATGFSGGNIFETGRQAIVGALDLLLIIVLSFYFSVTRDSVENFLRIITPSKNENYILNLWGRAKRKIGGWLQGQLMLGVLMCALLYPALAILGVKHALLLSIVAGMLELIPIFGSSLAAVPAVIIALLDGGVALAFLVLGYYLIVQQFESNIFYPLVVKKIIGISPLVVIVALVVGAKLAGVWGVILAVPLSVILVEYLEDIDKKKVRNA